LAPALKFLGWTIHDEGNLKFEPVDNDPDDHSVHHPRQVGKATQKLHEHVYNTVSSGKLALTLGGDHSLAMGSISGSLRHYPDACIIWIDAHADINTPDTTQSGNLHGMPVGFLMGLEQHPVAGFEWLKPCLATDRIVYIGLRDVDEGEKVLLKKHNIKAFSMTEVDRLGIGEVVKQALDHVNPKRDRPVHLSFDVDGIDPTVVPSTGTRVKGGLTFREARHICESVYETGKLVSMDIVEVNPKIGTEQNVKDTAAISVELAKFALGSRLIL